MDNAYQNESLPRETSALSAGAGDLNSTTVHGGLFALYAVELFLLGAVVWAWIINRHSFPGQVGDTNLIWGLLGLAAAGWSGLYLLLSWQAASRGDSDYARNLLAIAVVSGSVLMGVLLLGIAREFVANPFVLDVRSRFAVTRVENPATESAVAVGDATSGAKWFAMTCITCHGPTGDGVLNAAPSLRGSQFVAAADNATIMSLIRMGRPATDPSNKTGKVMPARGGNPFLDESKIADLAAFVKQIDSQPASPSASGGSAVSTDFANLQSRLAGRPVSVVNKWTLSELGGLQPGEDEPTVTLGMQAFVKATCNKCHMAAVEGLELGPTLDQVVKKYKREDLLAHIIEPSREINEQFQSDSILLLDGRTIIGVVVSENDQQVELLTDLLKPDLITTVLLDDIDDRVKSKLSPMPVGLADVLTKEEIGGLVAYVDAVGRQLGALPAVVLNRWVVPAATDVVLPTALAVSRPVASRPYSVSKNTDDSARYRWSFSWLFVTATSVMAMHFLWLTGTGAAVVLHRELQLSESSQRLLSRQAVLFWSIGLAWMALWFVLFFLWG